MEPTLWKLSKFFPAAESFRVRGGIFDFTPNGRYNTGERISEKDQKEIVKLRRQMAKKYEHYRTTMDFSSAAELTKAEVLRDYLKLT